MMEKDTVQKEFMKLQRQLKDKSLTADQRKAVVKEYNRLVPLFNSYNNSIGKPANATKISIKKAMTGSPTTNKPTAHSGTKTTGAMGHKTVSTPKPKLTQQGKEVAKSVLKTKSTSPAVKSKARKMTGKDVF